MLNPILPARYLVPDVEARQWPDGRIYLYGSLDLGDDTLYCSETYRVFSSGDLRQWTDHGVSFSLKESHASGARRLYAPDCFRLNDRY